MRKLVLFDIDGTLLNPDGAGRRAMIAAFEQVFGTAGPIETYSMAGKVDSQIVMELMTAAGLSKETVHGRLPEYFAAYAGQLRHIVDQHQVRTLPGVVQLLDRLSANRDVVIGLLTGNTLLGAREKLRSAGLAGYFDGLGAFGDDALRRPELPAIAVQRARDTLSHEFRGKDVVIIGDTPLDIDCGRALGAQSIAVATGPYTCPELQEHRPDFCFPDLTATDAIVEAILDDQSTSR